MKNKPRGYTPRSAQNPIWLNITLLLVFLVIFILIIVNGRKESIEGYNFSKKANRVKIDAAVKKMYAGLSASEINELNGLILKGMMKLTDNERSLLQKLQRDFVYGGYRTLSDEDVETMRQLNFKGVSLLSEDEVEKFKYLMDKAKAAQYK
jgi:hypothetical protein